MSGLRWVNEQVDQEEDRTNGEEASVGSVEEGGMVGGWKGFADRDLVGVRRCGYQSCFRALRMLRVMLTTGWWRWLGLGLVGLGRACYLRHGFSSPSLRICALWVCCCRGMWDGVEVH